jgi:hypothetical protein
MTAKTKQIGFKTENKKDSTVIKVNKNISYLSSGAVATPISWFEEEKKAIQTSNDYINWGVKNDYPQEIRNITLRNYVAPALLKFKVSAAIGKGYLLYKSIYEGDKEIKELVNNPEIEDFLEKIDYESYLQEAVTDLEWYEMLHTEFIRTKLGKIDTFKHLEAMYTRCAKRNSKGIIDKFYYGDFSDKNIDSKDLTQIQAYNYDETKKQNKFLLRSTIPTPGYLYYPPAAWHSSALWMQVSNEIPKFKANGMQNAMLLRYHIQYPSNYFIEAMPDEDNYTDEDRETAKKAIFQQIDELLTGTQNAQKAFYSEFQVDPITGKKMDGWIIETIKDESNYDAHKTDNEHATSAICSAHSVNPTLANVILNSSFSSKGSELRNAFKIYTELYTYKTRQLVTKPFELTKKINGWDKEIKIGFRDLVLTTLDENPTGSTNAL